MSMISITKLFDSLAIKLGKETADDLITFVQNKNDKDLESKLSMFATKEDLAKGLTNLESKMNEWRIETKDEFVKFDSRMSEWKSEVNGNFAKLDTKISESETRVIKKINESEISTIKWTVGLLVALATLFLLCLKLIVPD